MSEPSVVASTSIVLPEIEPELLAKHFKRKHGPGAYYGQAETKA